MHKIPIAIRTLERPVFLDTTIRSIKSSNIPDCSLIVIDDCSGQVDSKKHLFSSDQFRLSAPFYWPTSREWETSVGKIRSPQGLTGISKELEVITTGARKGDVGGLFWIIDYMMTRFADSEAIIVVEGDCVMREDWYSVSERFFVENLKKESDRFGLLTCYYSKTVPMFEESYLRPRTVSRKTFRKSNNRWDCSKSISGQMLLVTRELYDKCKVELKRSRPQKEKSGDHAIAVQCVIRGLDIVSTHPSYFQHVGFDSLLWPTKGIRVAGNFSGMCFEKFDKDGYAYSDKWILSTT